MTQRTSRVWICMTAGVLGSAGLMGCAGAQMGGSTTTGGQPTGSNAASAISPAAAAPSVGTRTEKTQPPAAYPAVATVEMPVLAPPSSPPAPPVYDGSRPMARITTPQGERVITADQVLRPLVEAHGLGMLLQVVQLELAKDQAEVARIPVTADDIRAETDLTLGKLYEQTDQEHDKKIEEYKKAGKVQEAALAEKEKLADRKRAVDTLMEQQRITSAELDLLLQTNAYLRKVATVRVKANITDEMLHQEFASRYNEQVRIRHIELVRGQDVTEAKRRLAAGEPFEKVAREMSFNKATAAMDGAVPPFSLANPNLPAVFKQTAFALKPGDVSDPINIEDHYQIIKVEGRVPPKSVTFEQVKESLNRDLVERGTLAMMGQIRAIFGDIARKQLRIEDPVLNRQFQEKIDAFNKRVADEALILADQERQRDADRAATRPSTKPATPDFSTSPTTAPIAPATTVPSVSAPAAPAATAPATKPAGAIVPTGSPK